jgi:hypothetical protein
MAILCVLFRCMGATAGLFSSAIQTNTLQLDPVKRSDRTIPQGMGGKHTAN